MYRVLLTCVVAMTLACGSEVPLEDLSSSPQRIVRVKQDLAVDHELAAEVKDAFLHAWSAYERCAWGHDALKPLSCSGEDWYAVSLIMTPVDAYDTMVLMGLDEQASQAKALIFEQLTFEHDISVQVFEMTIRLLGGMITAYQLDGDSRWLELATDLADRMMPAFDSPTGMPYVNVNLVTGVVEKEDNNPAEIGTLMLEFGQLSRLTGDMRYYDAAKAAIIELHSHRSELGLVGTIIDVESGRWLNSASHVGARIDSYYEYLLKAWLLFGDDAFLPMWEKSRDAANTYVAHSSDQLGLWYGAVDMDTGERLNTNFGALHAFFPAVLALGGDLERADSLMGSVYSMWTRFDLEPELFDYSSGEILYPGYILRPEALESAYYLFLLTGEERYREMGSDIFHRIVATTRVENGFAHVEDVRTKELRDAMQSFFLAETLKYAYLLADPTVLDFDVAVFNTEAHPFWPVEGVDSVPGR